MRSVLVIIPWLFLLSCVSENPKLVWNEEFDKEGTPDASKWTLIEGNGCPELCGFGNNEKQFYTQSSDNITVKEGKLVLTAHHHPDSSVQYTSAKLISKNKGDWNYGTIEIRAKLPEGKGTWPAIWMMPTLNERVRWPLDGEIDIMEHVGYHEGWVHGAVHTKDYNGMFKTQKVDSIYVEDVVEEFHTYSLQWNPDRIVWKMDGRIFHTYNRLDNDTENWPFDKPFHLIINLAVGGNWAGAHGIDSTKFPQKLEIDYVRVYELGD